MGEVVQFPAKAEAKKQRSRWRHITREEYELLVQFSQNPDLWGTSPFVRAMIEKARVKGRITDNQGKAILDVARDWGLIGKEPAASLLTRLRASNGQRRAF
jgi:hypothetical protein